MLDAIRQDKYFWKRFQIDLTVIAIDEFNLV